MRANLPFRQSRPNPLSRIVNDRDRVVCASGRGRDHLDLDGGGAGGDRDDHPDHPLRVKFWGSRSA